jgi:hypothetical protein
VTEPLIRRATVGMKEGDTTISSVTNQVFAPLSRRRVKELGIGEEEEARYVNRLSHSIECLNNPASIANSKCKSVTLCFSLTQGQVVLRIMLIVIGMMQT